MGKYVKNYSACIGISIVALMLMFTLYSCAANKSKPAPVHNEQTIVNTASDTDTREKVYSLDEIDRMPLTIKGARLRYPFEAMKEKIEGKVVVELILDKEGKVKDPHIVSAEPPKIFDSAAIDFIARSQYQPGYKDGKPVNVKVIWPIEFKLPNQR